MAEKYIVQVLSDEEFDSLPYEGISDSLGLADQKRGMAFVRSTGVKEWDMETLTHEVNHLIEKNSEHMDYQGIQHKKGGALRSILPTVLGGLAYLVPGIGPVLGPLIGAASNIGMDQYAKSNHPEQLGEPGRFGDILGAGALGGLGGFGAGKALTGGIAGGIKAGSGFLSKAGGIVKGALLGTPATQGGQAMSVINPTAAASASGFSPASAGLLGSAGVLGGVSNPYLKPGSLTAPSGKLPTSSSLNSTAAPAMSLANGGVGDAAGNLLGSPSSSPSVAIPNAIKAGGASITPAAAPATSAAKAPFSFKDLINPATATGQTAIGGASLLGSMATPQPQFEMPDSVEQLRSKIMAGQGLSPLGQQAQSELSRILSSTPQELYAPGNDAYFKASNDQIDKRYDEAKKQLDASYNLVGGLGGGEYQDQLRQLLEAQADAKSAYAQSENQRRFELARTQQYQAVQDSLGVDKNTMDDLVGLTGLDVQTAAMVYGARAADVQAIREALGTVGTELLLKGSGISNNKGINITLGGK